MNTTNHFNHGWLYKTNSAKLPKRFYISLLTNPGQLLAAKQIQNSADPHRCF